MLSSSLRYSIINNQSALSKVSKEATTGRFADVGLQLGPTAGSDVALRADMSFADQLVDTNGLVAGRLDVTQDRITQLGSTATDFLKDLIAARDADDWRAPGSSCRRASRQSAGSDRRAQRVFYNGSYLFGGINTQNAAPITVYAAGSTSKNAVDADFAALPPTGFGFPQITSPSAQCTASPPSARCRRSSTPASMPSSQARPGTPTGHRPPTRQLSEARISTTEVDHDTSVQHAPTSRLPQARGGLHHAQRSRQHGPQPGHVPGRRGQGDRPGQQRDRRSCGTRRHRRVGPASDFHRRPTSSRSRTTFLTHEQDCRWPWRRSIRPRLRCA